MTDAAPSENIERMRKVIALTPYMAHLGMELVEAGAAIYPDLERAVQTLGRYVAYMAERRGMQ